MGANDKREAISGQISGLRALLERIDDWIVFSGSVLGKRLLVQREQDREAIRNRYLTIDPASPGACLKLAELQARERQITEDIEVFGGPREKREEVARSIEALMAELAEEDKRASPLR